MKLVYLIELTPSENEYLKNPTHRWNRMHPIIQSKAEYGEGGDLYTCTTWWSLWSTAQEAQMPFPMHLKQKRLHSLFAETPWIAQVAKKSAFNNGINHTGPSARWVSSSAIIGPPCSTTQVLALSNTRYTRPHNESQHFNRLSFKDMHWTADVQLQCQWTSGQKVANKKAYTDHRI